MKVCLRVQYSLFTIAISVFWGFDYTISTCVSSLSSGLICWSNPLQVFTLCECMVVLPVRQR